MKLVIISDTHTKEKEVIFPKGDILIHCGDFDIRDEKDLQWVIEWFESLDYSHIVFCGGNHDLYLEQLFKAGITPEMPKNIHYLCNSSVEIEGIRFFGSPYSPTFGIGWSFNAFLDELKTIWNSIPENTDILLTHCPPFGINDNVNGICQGCPALRDRIKELKPKIHCHAHIHEGAGVYQDEHTIYINGSVLDEYYNLVNKPIVINYEN